MKDWRCGGCVDIRVELLSVWLVQGRLFQLSIGVQVAETNPVVQPDSKCDKQKSKRPEVELNAVLSEQYKI